jgi:prepilin-type processing-associated H-X9-DG protein
MIADYLFNGHPESLQTAGVNSIWVCPTAGSPESLYGTPEGASGGTPEMYNGSSTTTTTPGNFFGLWGTDTSPLPHSYRYTPHPYPFFQCYVMNSKLFSQLTDGQYITHVKLAQLRPGCDVVIMTEKMTQYGEYQVSSDPEVYHYYPNPGNYNLSPQGYTNNIGQPKACNTRFTTRHRHGGYLLFADGHVAWFAWTQAQGLLDPTNPGTVSDINRPDSHVIWSPYGAVQ